MIERARVAGREASEGAVTGFFTGILTAPFRVVGGVGNMIAPGSSAAKYFTEQDYELMRQAIGPLSEASVGITQSWQNPESDTRGTLTLLRIYEHEGGECRDVKNQAWKGSTKVYDDVLTFCESGDGRWEQRNLDANPQDQ
jgi:surface antigen